VPERPSIYLDHQSASPLRPEVFDAMRPFLQEGYGNPGGLHRRGRRVREAIEKARAQAAAFLGAENPESIIFTSSGTEAANLALRGVVEWLDEREEPGSFLTSAIEHPSVLACARWAHFREWQVEEIGVDGDGRLNLGRLRSSIEHADDDHMVLAIQLANPDIGTLQPVAEISRNRGNGESALFCDATAATGWHPINVKELGVDLLTAVAHRIGGPQGVGVLYRDPSTPLAPQILGGSQEHGLRAGTENVAGIFGTGVALELAAKELDGRISNARRLQTMLWEGLKEHVPRLRLIGPEPGPERLPNQLNLSAEGVEGEALALALDVQGIQVHAGASCVAKHLKVPPVLAAIGVEPKLAQGSVTFSLGPENTEEEIRTVLEVVPKVVARLRSMSPSGGGAPGGVTLPPRAE